MNTLYIQKNLFLWALSTCLIVTNTAWAQTTAVHQNNIQVTTPFTCQEPLQCGQLEGLDTLEIGAMPAQVRAHTEAESDAWTQDVIEAYDEANLDELTEGELEARLPEAWRGCIRQHQQQSQVFADLSIEDYVKACVEALKNKPKNRQECEEQASCKYIICLATCPPNIVQCAACGIKYSAEMLYCAAKFNN